MRFFPTGIASRLSIVSCLVSTSLRVCGREWARATFSGLSIGLRQGFQISTHVFRKISSPKSDILLRERWSTKSYLYIEVIFFSIIVKFHTSFITSFYVPLEGFSLSPTKDRGLRDACQSVGLRTLLEHYDELFWFWLRKCSINSHCPQIWSKTWRKNPTNIHEHVFRK